VEAVLAAGFVRPGLADEKTAVRFTLDEGGKVIDVNSRQKSLIENFRDWHRNGADLDPKTGYVKKL
jgi:hypothetical protein